MDFSEITRFLMRNYVVTKKMDDSWNEVAEQVNKHSVTHFLQPFDI